MKPTEFDDELFDEYFDWTDRLVLWSAVMAAICGAVFFLEY